MISTLISYPKWERDYKPLPNHLDARALFDGLMFGCDGAEAAAVKQTPIEHVWTLLDEDGETWIAPGWHFVNRLGYFITDEAWTDEALEVNLLGDEPRYAVMSVGMNDAVVFDNKLETEVCVISNYEACDGFLDDCEARAKAIADALNATGFDYVPSYYTGH